MKNNEQKNLIWLQSMLKMLIEHDNNCHFCNMENQPLCHDHAAIQKALRKFAQSKNPSLFQPPEGHL